MAELSTPPSTSRPLAGARCIRALRNAVRLRVEGERVALPAPALTPYLVGLLVLLGMLGTLLGMMATLRGTGIALESATDLQAIRGSLAAPVKGLGFAFGTSIAGVASSAMLGLLSALCRRERLEQVQRLDVKIATTLRVHSQAHQRDESFRLLQQQTEVDAGAGRPPAGDDGQRSSSRASPPASASTPASRPSTPPPRRPTRGSPRRSSSR